MLLNNSTKNFFEIPYISGPYISVEIAFFVEMENNIFFFLNDHRSLLRKKFFLNVIINTVAMHMICVVMVRKVQKMKNYFFSILEEFSTHL